MASFSILQCITVFESCNAVSYSVSQALPLYYSVLQHITA